MRKLERMRGTVSALIISSFLLASCASSSNKISATYVSPLQYHSYDCDQVGMEMMRVSRRVNQVAGVQDAQATKDSVALGVGLVLFWPALFFMIGKDQKEELGRLKGEYEALESTAIAKKCNVAAEIEAARKMEEDRQKAKQTTQKEMGKAND